MPNYFSRRGSTFGPFGSWLRQFAWGIDQFRRQRQIDSILVAVSMTGCGASCRWLNYSNSCYRVEPHLSPYGREYRMRAVSSETPLPSDGYVLVIGDVPLEAYIFGDVKRSRPGHRICSVGPWASGSGRISRLTPQCQALTPPSSALIAMTRRGAAG